MAIDITNRNPSDPNGVAAISSNQVPAWISDDWGTLTLDPAEGQSRKLHEVRVVRVTTNDGREFRAVLGSDGQPMSVIGDTTGIDKDQASHWQQAGPKQQPPGGSPTQRRQAPDGLTHIYGYNPTTGQYDDDQGAVASSAKPPIPAGGTSATEGTPDPSKPGGWDNSRPRQVIKDKNGTVVWSEELSGSDLTAWRANQQANQTQTKREPIKERPGYSSVTTTTNGNTETHTEKDDAPGVAVQLPPAPITAKPEQDASGAWGYWDAQPGQTPVWKPIAGGPGGKKYTEVKQDPTTGTWSGFTAEGKWEPIEGGPGVVDKGGFRPVPAGAPRYTPDPTDPTGDMGLTRYHEQLLAYAAATPSFTRADGQYLIDQAGETAKVAAARRTADQTQASTARTQDITQRGQDLDEVASRRTAADTMYTGLDKENQDLALKMMGGTGGLAAHAFRTALEAGRVNAQQWGGLADVPPVPPAYLTATRGAVPGSESTQVVLHPGGAVSVSPVGSPPPPGSAVAPVAAGVTATTAAAVNPSGANVQAANDATMAGSTAAFGATGVPPVPPPMAGAIYAGPNGESYAADGTIYVGGARVGTWDVTAGQPPGTTPTGAGTSPRVTSPAGQPGTASQVPIGTAPSDPYAAVVGAARTPPPFQPDIARLRAQFPDASDADIEEAIRQHMGSAAA